VTPLLDDDLGFNPCPKPLQAQAFVSEFAVEVLIGAALPWLAGIAQRHIHAILGGPSSAWHVTRTPAHCPSAETMTHHAD
jgi:hypothetical protein